MVRIVFLIGGIALGAACAVAALPSLGWLGPSPVASKAPRNIGERTDSDIKLTEEQVQRAGILIVEAHEGVLIRGFQVPGTIVPSAERLARVAVKLLGTVAELRKRLGDNVSAGEVVAVIDSREVADAKSEFLATRSTYELQQTLFQRAELLWERKVMTENDYLRARATAEDARIKMESARQKLFALGLPEVEITALPDQPPASLRRHELRSPITGRVAERRVDLGALVGREGQESELYVIADLSEVWADLAVPPAELSNIREGQEITLFAGANSERAPAKVIFVSPLLDKDTRAARVVALLPNPTQQWRPGSFVTAEIPLAPQPASIVVPKFAIQSFKGKPVVFVRSNDGFEKREVKTGREDDRAIEIVAGLAAGERIAVSNTFSLKAELGKSDAED